MRGASGNEEVDRDHRGRAAEVVLGADEGASADAAGFDNMSDSIVHLNDAGWPVILSIGRPPSDYFIEFNNEV